MSNQSYPLRPSSASASNASGQSNHACSSTPNIYRSNGASSGEDPPHRDQQTLNVVQGLKRAVQARLENNKKVDESFIEEQVTRIRVQGNSAEFDMDSWKKRLPRDVQDCSDTVLRQTMAYGNDPGQLIPILKDKMNQERSSQGRPDTSLTNLKEPLTALKRKLNGEQPPNLFAAVLKDIDINRADRMFYCEARRLMPALTNYTMYHAHDQVQAIRLTQYQSDDKYELEQLIRECRTFDDAYAYLQDLARRQENTERNKAKSASGYSNRSPRGSIIRNADPDSNMADQTYTNSMNITTMSSSTTQNTRPFQPSSGSTDLNRQFSAHGSR